MKRVGVVLVIALAAAGGFYLERWLRGPIVIEMRVPAAPHLSVTGVVIRPSFTEHCWASMSDMPCQWAT